MSMYLSSEHGNNQIHPHQHNISQVSASVTLLEVGNALLSRGQADDAMSMFDAAHVALRMSSVNASAFTKQLQWGQSQLLGGQPRGKRDETESSADTYHEDECDIGPRPFQTPILPDENCFSASSFVNSTPNTCTSTTDNTTIDATQLTEAFILYNKSLVLHSKFDFLEAMRLYDATVQILTAFQGQQQQSMTNHNINNNLHPKLSTLGMSVHNNLGVLFYIEGAEDMAMSHFESALIFAKELSNSTDGQLRLDIATVISNWCRLHWMRGDLNEHVYNGLREVLRIRSSILSTDHILVASAHYNLGVAEYARRRNEEATSHLMQYLQVAALKGQQACMDLSELDPIPALVYILLIKNEEKEEDSMAQELVRGLRTLQEKRSDLGPHDPLVASVLNYVGTILFHQRDFNHSLLFFQEELRLEEALVENSGDVSVAVTANNIGRVLQEQQRLPEAILYYTRALQSEYGDEALQMTVKSIKDQLYNTAAAPLKAKSEILELPRSTLNLYSTIWYNLGLIHDRLGSFGEAIKSFQMSLALRRSMFGDDSADVACLMYNIAVLQMEQEMLTDATVSFREALRIRRVAATGQLNDLHVVKTLQKLASLHKSKGNIEGALEAYREILQIQEVSADFDERSRKKETGTTLREISELYYAASNVEMAILRARESVALLRELMRFPPGSAAFGNQVAEVEELFASLLLLGSLHHEKCEADQARALFAEASSIVQQATQLFSRPTALNALCEVSQMLATCHCSPEA